jgi:hypothetical protein
VLSWGVRTEHSRLQRIETYEESVTTYRTHFVSNLIVDKGSPNGRDVQNCLYLCSSVFVLFPKRPYATHLTHLAVNILITFGVELAYKLSSSLLNNSPQPHVSSSLSHRNVPLSILLPNAITFHNPYQVTRQSRSLRAQTAHGKIKCSELYNTTFCLA